MTSVVGGVTLTTLEGGVRVITEAMPAVRSAALGFYVGTGSALEADPEAGLSHLLEHMLFRGTARFASHEIDEMFDAMGAELNAGTGKESTSIYSRVLDVHVDEAFDAMADMVWRPALRDLETEREVVLEEIAMYEDEPQEKVFDVLNEAIFGAHPLGRPIIGHADVIRRVTRDELAAFHGPRYGPANVVVAAAGSIDHDAIVAMVSDRLADAPEAGAPLRLGAIPAVAQGATFVGRETEQVHVCLGGRGIARDDERRFALRLLDNILGGTSSSRLFQEVREKRGLAYSVYSFASMYEGTGEMGLYVGTRADNLAEAMAVVASEIERFLAEPATAAELDRAKENVKGRFVLSLESTSSRMNRIGSAVLAGLPVLEVDEILERIDAVTAEEVADLAAELLAPGRLSAAGVGPDEDAFRGAVAAVGAA